VLSFRPIETANCAKLIGLSIEQWRSWQFLAVGWQPLAGWASESYGMDKFTVGVVGGVLALVAAALVAAVVIRRDTPPPDLTTPGGVVLAYALAEQRGDAQSAWDLLARSAQARGDHDRFLAAAGRGDSDREYLSIEDEQTDASGAGVVLVRTYASGGIFGRNSSSNRTTVRLVREDGDWRISVPPDEYVLSIPKGVRE
jgi:hypothetical protein